MSDIIPEGVGQCVMGPPWGSLPADTMNLGDALPPTLFMMVDERKRAKGEVWSALVRCSSCNTALQELYCMRQYEEELLVGELVKKELKVVGWHATRRSLQRHDR